MRNFSSLSANENDSQIDFNQQDGEQPIFEHKAVCHVFDECVQNGKTVVSILHHLFSILRQQTPKIKYVHLRSDNAGCYHGAEALLSVQKLFEETGIWIKSFDFCDPQSGKGPCDRTAAVIKCCIRRFIDEKNDCTNATEFINAAGELRNGCSMIFFHF